MDRKTHFVTRYKILQIMPAPDDLVGCWDNRDGTITTGAIACLALVEPWVREYDEKGRGIGQWEPEVSDDPARSTVLEYVMGEYPHPCAEDGNFMQSFRRSELHYAKEMARDAHQRRQQEALSEQAKTARQ